MDTLRCAPLSCVLQSSRTDQTAATHGLVLFFLTLEGRGLPRLFLDSRPIIAKDGPWALAKADERLGDVNRKKRPLPLVHGLIPLPKPVLTSTHQRRRCPRSLTRPRLSWQKAGSGTKPRVMRKADLPDLPAVALRGPMGAGSMQDSRRSWSR